MKESSTSLTPNVVLLSVFKDNMCLRKERKDENLETDIYTGRERERERERERGVLKADNKCIHLVGYILLFDGDFANAVWDSCVYCMCSTPTLLAPHPRTPLSLSL